LRTAQGYSAATGAVRALWHKRNSTYRLFPGVGRELPTTI
jgi:hypothetical protein